MPHKPAPPPSPPRIPTPTRNSAPTPTPPPILREAARSRPRRCSPSPLTRETPGSPRPTRARRRTARDPCRRPRPRPQNRRPQKRHLDILHRKTPPPVLQLPLLERGPWPRATTAAWGSNVPTSAPGNAEPTVLSAPSDEKTWASPGLLPPRSFHLALLLLWYLQFLETFWPRCSRHFHRHPQLAGDHQQHPSR